jgi:hypothetical protein
MDKSLKTGSSLSLSSRRRLFGGISDEGLAVAIAGRTSPPLRATRALQLLASSPFGATEAIMLARGFTRWMIASLSGAGLATAGGKTVKAWLADQRWPMVRWRRSTIGHDLARSRRSPPRPRHGLQISPAARPRNSAAVMTSTRSRIKRSGYKPSQLT